MPAVWTGHDTGLVLYALLAIAGVILPITLPRRHAALRLAIAVPTVIVSGPTFARFAARWAKADPPPDLVDRPGPRWPSVGATQFTILLPVVLMLTRTIADVSLDEGTTVRTWGRVHRPPIVALLVAMYTLGFAQGCGSLFFSHVNAAGYWLVKEFFGMTVADTIRAGRSWRRWSRSWGSRWS